MRNRRIFIIPIKRVKLILPVAIGIFAFLLYTLTIKSFSQESYQTNTSLNKPKLAIIIDDFGQNRNGVKEMMGIDRPLTFAIMPFLKYSVQDAKEAHHRGHEVIVHLPMQSHKMSKDSWLGPRPIKLDSSNKEIREIVLASINAVPFAVGVNNHMGVMASEDERIMTCVMKVIKEKGLYFVDSRTGYNPVGRESARKNGAKFAERNVFLDHSSKDKNHIKNQIAVAGDLAIKKGYAVAIGHVGSVGGAATAESIKEMIPQLEKKGIELVYVSKVLRR